MRYKQAWKQLRDKMERDATSKDMYVREHAKAYLQLMKELERTPS